MCVIDCNRMLLPCQKMCSGSVTQEIRSGPRVNPLRSTKSVLFHKTCANSVPFHVRHIPEDSLKRTLLGPYLPLLRRSVKDPDPQPPRSGPRRKRRKPFAWETDRGPDCQVRDVVNRPSRSPGGPGSLKSGAPQEYTRE